MTRHVVQSEQMQLLQDLIVEVRALRKEIGVPEKEHRQPMF